MKLLANVFRLCLIAGSMGLIVGCGGAPQYADLQELEAIGLVTDQGTDALEDSLLDLMERLRDGDVEVAEVLVRWGLLSNVPGAIQYLERQRTIDNYMRIDQTIEILQAADSASVGRQYDYEPRQMALDSALSEVPNNYHGLLTEWCINGPAALMELCVEQTFNMLAQTFEPPDGLRRQFGAWETFTADYGNSYLIISETDDGAFVCGEEYVFTGTFDDNGALILERAAGATPIIVQERGGVEILAGGVWPSTFQRVIEVSVEAWEASDSCRSNP